MWASSIAHANESRPASYALPYCDGQSPGPPGGRRRRSPSRPPTHSLPKSNATHMIVSVREPRPLSRPSCRPTANQSALCVEGVGYEVNGDAGRPAEL